MADQCHMCLLGLIILCSLLTGTSEAEDTRVFCSSGEDVRLPCNNTLSDCTSTTWIYNRQSVTVELINSGIKKNETERRERLSLGSDCSLNIKKVTKEDYGSYTCRQFVNGQQQGPDARVYLHVLHVSPSSSQTEIRSGSSVTLYCRLNLYEVSCETLVRSEGLQMIWVNQTGVNLQTDSRYLISSPIISSTHCLIALTTTILNEDHHREWRCQVTQRNQQKISATFTVKYSAPVDSTTLTPVRSSNSEEKSSRTTAAAPTQQDSETTSAPKQQVIVGVVAALAVLLLAVMFWVICKKAKKADNRREAEDSVELKDEVTYTEVATFSKNQAKENQVHDDKVTYASIRGATAGPQNNCSQ